MAADLHIHIASSKIIKDVREYLKSDGWSSVFGNYQMELLVGGRWIPLREYSAGDIDGSREIPLDYDEDAVMQTPNCWIGEVSWLKASITGDNSYIPATIEEINKIIGDGLPVIDDAFIEHIEKAFHLENNTQYELNEWKSVKEFLEQYKGERCFTISW